MPQIFAGTAVGAVNHKGSGSTDIKCMDILVFSTVVNSSIESVLSFAIAVYLRSTSGSHELIWQH